MDYFGNLDNEALLGLARQAGYLPEEKGAEEPGAPMPEEVHQDYREFVPKAMGYEPGSEGVIDMERPGPGMPQVPSTISKGQSASVSNRGFDAGAYNQVAATKPGLYGDLARADATADENGEPMLAAETGAHASKVAAAANEAKANVDAIHQEGVDALLMQKLQDDFGVEEAKINARAAALSNQAKADYLTSLNDFRASRVDPSQLWHNMTGGERFGTLVSAFVHDFLGARGINTSAMSTFNKAIDRNIDAQLQAIKTKGEAAEGFKSLWYMQRNQSASDAEARARVRGFLLDGAKQAVIANMAPYKAALASAQGQAAIAKINEEFSKNLVDIYKHIDSNSVALRSQAIDIWKTNVNAAIESRAVSVREAQERREAKKDLGPPETINDPETGNPVALFKPWIQKEERSKTREILEDANVVGQDISELRRLARVLGNGGIDPINGTRFAGDAQQEYDSLATRLAHHMVKALGERATDKDVDQMLKGLRTPSFLNQATADHVIAFTQDRILTPARVRVRSQGYIPGEDGIIRDAPDDLIFKSMTADARGTHSPPPKGTAQQQLERAATLDIKGDLPEDEQTGDLMSAHQEMVRQRSDLFTHKEDSGASEGAWARGVGKEAPNKPTVWEKKVVEFARLARDPDPEVSRQAKEALRDMAGPYINSGISDDPQAYMAAWALSQLEDTNGQ